MDSSKLKNILFLKSAFTGRNATSILLVAVFFLVYIFSGGKISTPNIKAGSSFGSIDSNSNYRKDYDNFHSENTITIEDSSSDNYRNTSTSNTNGRANARAALKHPPAATTSSVDSREKLRQSLDSIAPKKDKDAATGTEIEEDSGLSDIKARLQRLKKN